MPFPDPSGTHYLCLPLADVPISKDWLLRQHCPVIAIGRGNSKNVDVVLADEKELETLTSAIDRSPRAAMILVQVLRTIEHLSTEQGLNVESLAYATLQGGEEYRAWIENREGSPQLISGNKGEAVVIRREGNVLFAELNRPEHRNSLSVEMRDSLVRLFELVLADKSIEKLHLRGRGACFSVGGELREFGLTPDAATGHWVRSCQNPSRLLSRCSDRVQCHLHSACLGSGIELPAFASYLTAAPKTFFQLPELSFGLIPGAGGCVSISRRIGRQRTAWLALSGKKIKAQKALEWGLIDEITE